MFPNNALSLYPSTVLPGTLDAKGKPKPSIKTQSPFVTPCRDPDSLRGRPQIPIRHYGARLQTIDCLYVLVQNRIIQKTRTLSDAAFNPDTTPKPKHPKPLGFAIQDKP